MLIQPLVMSTSKLSKIVMSLVNTTIQHSKAKIKTSHIITCDNIITLIQIKTNPNTK
jgi:hypothetical protein